MRATTLQDIIIDSNGIIIIESGTHVIITEEIILESFLSKIKSIIDVIKNPKMFNSRAATNINDIINKVIAAEKDNTIEKNTIVNHNLDKNSAEAFTTIIKGPTKFIKKLFRYFKHKTEYSCTFVPGYVYDIDDLAALKHKAPKDEIGPFSKLYISHLTQSDYDKAANLKQGQEEQDEQQDQQEPIEQNDQQDIKPKHKETSYKDLDIEIKEPVFSN